MRRELRFGHLRLPPGSGVAAAMAMQASLGVTRFVILVSAGLAGSVLIKNNKLGDFIGDLTKVCWVPIDSGFPCCGCWLVPIIVGLRFYEALFLGFCCLHLVATNSGGVGVR